MLKAKRPKIFSEGFEFDENLNLPAANPREKLLKKLLEMNLKKPEAKE